MKLLMEQWRKFLKEGISDVVYHYTSGLEKGAKILKQNRFMASGGFTKDVETQYGKGRLYYFSTARTPVNSYTGNYPQGVIFKLDGRALAEKYKAAPVDYWGSAEYKKSSKLAANVGNTGATEGFEAEDRVLLDEPYINDADRYIDEIHFAIPLYRFEKGMFDDEPKRKAGSSIEAYTMKGLKDGVAIAEERNIPYYIHIDKTTFPFVEVGKKKALTSLAAFMEELEKSGVKVNEPPEQSDRLKKYKVYGVDQVFLYVQAAQDILAGKEQLETDIPDLDDPYTRPGNRKKVATKIFRELTGEPDMRGRFYRDIDNPLQAIGSKPEGREVTEMLASLMRSTKQKTIKDFENYLNQVYKKNHPDGDPTGYRNS